MFEAVRANKIKSGILVSLVAAMLIVMGYLVGYSVGGGPQGAYIGILAAVVLWAILALVSFKSGDAVIMRMSNAVEADPVDYQQLHNVVEEMAIAAGMPKPRVYIIFDGSPNAFAAGRSPEKAVLAVTSGLLDKLNRDEQQGVVAHEMSHILNRDVLYMTMLGVMIGAIVLMCDFFLRYVWFTGGRRRSRSQRGGGGAQGIIAVIAIVMAILAPIIARVLYLATSRKREYLADANGAVLTRYPEGLASALEKIAGDSDPLESANRATAPMYIVNPLNRMGVKGSRLFSTHPPLEERVGILRTMGTNMSLADYEKAWQAVTSNRGRLFKL